MKPSTVKIVRRRVNLRDYLIVSTTTAIFLQQILTLNPIAIALGYPLVLFNIIVLLAADKLVIHRYHVSYLAALTVIGVVAGGLAGTPVNAVFSQVVGIALMSTYFFCVVFTTKWSPYRWIEYYSNFAFVLAIYGIINYFARYALGVGDRLTAMYSEPSFYINVTMPAVGFFALQYVKHRRYGLEFMILLFSYVLADSSAGFIGLILVAFFALKGRVKGWQIVAAVSTGCLLVVGLYFASENTRARVNDTAYSLITFDLKSANSSTYALLSNMYGAIAAFLDHPLFGVGIGGYQYAYAHYVGAALDQNQALYGLNMYDANSLYLRVMAELGIFGLVSLFGFLIVCSRVRDEKALLVRNALVPYFLERWYHSGHYFSVEMYFFVALFMMNYLDDRRRDNELPASGADSNHSKPQDIMREGGKGTKNISWHS